MKTLTRRLFDAAFMVALCGAADAIGVRLSKVFQEWSDSPGFLALATAQGFRKLDPMTPQQAAAFLRVENEKFINIAKTLNLVAQ